jgi:cytochrome c553
MKLTGLKLAGLAIVCTAAPSFALDLGSLSVRNCTWCHGSSAQGYSPAPRLAGQRPQYIERQLIDFREHTRDNPDSRQYMWGASAGVSRQRARDLANYFSTLPPKAADDGNRELVPIGRAIYQDGIPTSNIVSCVACHGPNGEGIGEIPRLGGLSYAYLKKRLEQWGEGYHATAKPPMPRIAGKLSPHLIVALASYLSFVK